MADINTILDDIVEDLKIELEQSDDKFNEELLASKVKQAIREVKSERKYPTYYTDEMKADDLENYYSTIRNIALFDYNQIGAEFQTSDTESSNNRVWVDRNKLFKGVIPIARV